MYHTLKSNCCCDCEGS